VDLLYVADGRTQLNGGGIQKWTFDGTNWILVGTYAAGVITNAGVRWLSAFTFQNAVYVVATTMENPSRAVLLVDDLVNPPVLSSVTVTPSGEFFRGCALAPR